MDPSPQTFQQLAGFLTSIGLGSLFTVDSTGQPSGWLWDQIVGGVSSEAQLLFALEQTPEFRQRFQVIFDMRDKAAKGEATYVPTVADVLNYENEFVRTMTAAGVPSWFYDSMDDAHNAMRTNLSVTQVADRIERGYGVMQQMPVEVKSAFNELYGQDAESVLLAAVLDPQKTLAEIDRAVRASQISGFGRRAGIQLTSEQAMRYSQNNLTQAQIESGIQAASALKPLTEANIGEQNQLELNTETALSAELGQSATDQALFENRLLTRRAGQQTVGGGALAGQSGITGAGVV